MTVQTVDTPVPDVLVESAGWRGALLYCLRVYLVARAAMFALGLLAMGLLPLSAKGSVPGWTGPLTATSGWHTAFTGWERADALWYLRIASSGYRRDDESAAFFPLFPMCVRAIGVVTGGHWLLAAYVVANLALIAALVLLYRLTELEHSRLRARRVVVLACVFPTSFFLFAPYSESLFFALSVGAFYCARRRLWAGAAALGFAAALTRSPGLLLAPAIALEALLLLRSATTVRDRLVRVLPGIAAAIAVPMGTAGYLAYWARYGDDWRRPLDLQKAAWSKEQSWPWETLESGFKTGVQYVGSFPGAYYTVDMLFVALLLATAVWATLRLRPTYALYVWLSVLFPMMLTWPGRPFLSLPRYFVVVFPVFWALAAAESRWRARDAVVALSAGGMAVLGTLFVTAYPIF